MFLWFVWSLPGTVDLVIQSWVTACDWEISFWSFLVHCLHSGFPIFSTYLQANVKDVIVSIPSSLTTKFIVNSTQSTQPPPTLRSIREQCHGVHLRLVNPQQARPQQRVDVIVMGPAEEVEKAQRLVDELNAKVAQLCAEVRIGQCYTSLHNVNVCCPRNCLNGVCEGDCNDVAPICSFAYCFCSHFSRNWFTWIPSFMDSSLVVRAQI